MITARTYTIGDGGQVRKLVDLAGAWIDVSITNTFPAAAGVGLFDVETDLADGDKVFVCGEGVIQDAIFGIYVSLNGGVTWFIPGGNYQTAVDVTGRLKWHEVHVQDANNIMVSGDLGYVAFSTDGGLTFNLSTQLPLLASVPLGPLLVPKCSSLHFISPTVGVVGTVAQAVLTVDGGITWSVLNGGNIIGAVPQLTTARGIHMSANQLVINILGTTGIWRSIDGGLTWTNTYFWVVRNGTHLTWTNDNELWAFGFQDERIYSTDAGLTWTIIQAWNPGGLGQLSGHFYLGQNGFWGQAGDILSTNNGSATGLISDSSYVPFAVWTWYIDSTCYLLVDCNGAVPSILVQNDLSAFVGQVIEVCPDDLPDPGPGVDIATGTPIPIPPLPDPGFTLHSLHDCCGLLPPITVSNNLTVFVNNNSILYFPSLSLTTCWNVEKLDTPSIPTLGVISLVGSLYWSDCASCKGSSGCGPIVTLDECTCFTIEEAPGCNGAITLLNIGPISPDCAQCANDCYRLVDCEDPNHFVITSDLEFLQYVGQVVQLQDCPDICWTVELTDCAEPVCLSPVIANFQTCVECLPPPPPPVPLELHTRRIKPGYYTPGCPPAYTEKVNCNYAEQMYNEILVTRYGITICCEEDRIKWTIKKQLLDFKALYDPNLCKCFLQSCCPPSCVEVILEVFNPIPCPPPTNVVAIITIVTPPCPAPGQIRFTRITISPFGG